MIEFMKEWSGLISSGLVVIIIIGGALYAMEHAAPSDVDDQEEDRPFTKRQYERAMYRIEMLIKLDPPKDSDAGRELDRLATKAEEYERTQGWVQ